MTEMSYMRLSQKGKKRARIIRLIEYPIYMGIFFGGGAALSFVTHLILAALGVAD